MVYCALSTDWAIFILIPLQFRLALFCAGQPLMRWVVDVRCLALHVDRGVAWRWGNDFQGDRRRTRTNNNSTNCCVFSICWSTFRPCVFLQGFAVLAVVGGGVEVVAVSTGCFVAQGLVPVFANSSGRWGPVAPVVFFSFSMFVVVVVAGYLPALAVVDYLRRLPVGE